METNSPQPMGQPVADFSLLHVGHGQSLSLAQYAQKKTLTCVIFWSAVCSHCRRYDDYLNKFGQREGRLGLLVVATREGESMAELTKCQHDRSLQFPLLFDAERKIAKAWHVHQTPRCFLLDSHLKLLYRGAIDNFKYPNDPDFQPYLDHAIADYLSGQPIRREDTPSFGCPTESVYYRQS